jgi:hypothetical protein
MSESKELEKLWLPLRVQGLHGVLSVLVVGGVVACLFVPKSVLATIPLIVICGLMLTVAVHGLSNRSSPLPLRQYESRAWLLGLSTFVLPIIGLPPTFSLSSDGADLFVRFLMVGYGVIYIPVALSLWSKARECDGDRVAHPRWIPNDGRLRWRVALGLCGVIVAFWLLVGQSPASKELQQEVVGKWELIDGRRSGVTAEFTKGGKVILSGQGWKGRGEVGTYSISGSQIVFQGDGRLDDPNIVDVELLSNDQLLMNYVQQHELDFGGSMAGKWQRVSDQDERPVTDPIAQYEQKLATLKYERDKVATLLERLQQDSAGILARLRNQGIESTEDLKKSRDWRLHAQELKDVATKHRQLTVQLSAYDHAISRLETMVRSIQREAEFQQVTPSSERLDQLSQTVRELDDELDSPGPATDVELEVLLKRMFQQDAK